MCKIVCGTRHNEYNRYKSNGMGVKAARAIKSEIKNTGPTSVLERLTNAETTMMARIRITTPWMIKPRCLGGG
jgi:hypothetical protein